MNVVQLSYPPSRPVKWAVWSLDPAKPGRCTVKAQFWAEARAKGQAKLGTDRVDACRVTDEAMPLAS
ncbi:MAG: hypothetical protein ACOY0T_37825 [Myxococcota bacterium]